MFDTPVALLTFNRPELTARLLKVLEQVKPARMFVVADGPRSHVAGDAEKCAAVRALFDHLPWECRVERNFAETNMGSFPRNSSGLSWVFEQVEEAIILEDDCIPSLSFFPYCAELLERYRDDRRVGVISGSNFVPVSREQGQASYFFSAYSLTWGWASWRRVWTQVDLTMSNSRVSEEKEMLRTLFPQAEEWQYWHELHRALSNGELKNAWDYQLILSSFRHSQLCIMPQANLISNVGFGGEATHCIWEGDPLANVPRSELDFPLIHPTTMWRSGSVDHEIFRTRFAPPASPALYQRVRNALSACVPMTWKVKLKKLRGLREGRGT